MKSKILFCDSLPVFEKLLCDGLISRDVSIVTRSFVMAKQIAVDCIYIDGNVTSEQRKLFKSGIYNIEQRLKLKLEREQVPSPLINIFLQFFNGFQKDILDVLTLETVFDPDCMMTVAVPKTNQAKIDEVLRPCWIDWLSHMDGYEQIDVNVQYHNERSPRGDVETRFIDRFRLGGFGAVLWKMAQQKWFPNSLFSDQSIGVIGQTELVRDGFINCFLHGHKPIFIIKPNCESAKIRPDIKLARLIIEKCSPIIQERLSFISNKYLRKLAEQVLTERLASEIGKYQFLLQAWRKELSNLPNLKCVLTGFIKGPDAMALARVCQERGIKIAACQHSVTREILDNVQERSVFFETCFCDLLFTMNPIAADLTRGLSLNRTVTVISKNWPSPFERVVGKFSKADKPALFVSTNLYSGHKPNGVPVSNDSDLSDLEIGLVQRIFGQVSLAIDYKPYPSVRQFDPDPVLKAVNEQKNMSVVGTHQDLRYLLNRYKMFITTKATSTVSWIVASKRPLVFIDHYCHARLSEEARQAFAESFFLFDQLDIGFEACLKEFLQRPFDEILEEWNSKSEQRLQTIENFFGGVQGTARSDIFEDIKRYCLDA